MNTDRKANLQRKLTLAPVPKPPAGLADRIKNEIPKHLRFDAERERERLSHSVAFNIRVAASILILISCAYLALQFMTRIDEEKPAAVPTMKRSLPALQPITQTVAPAAEPQMAEARPAPRKRGAPATPPARAAEVGGAPPKAVDIVAAPPPPPPPPVAAMAETREEAKMRTAALAGVDRDQMSKSVSRIEPEMTTSPVSGKIMVWTPTEGVFDGARRLDKSNVYELEPNAATIHLDERRLRLIPWKEASRQAKSAILSAELARGEDPHAVARAAREAGLTELADSIEKR